MMLSAPCISESSSQVKPDEGRTVHETTAAKETAAAKEPAAHNRLMLMVLVET
jgi:hypothetical protein